MFVPLFPFPVPIPLIGEQLLPPNRPALLCTACAAHRACSSFLLDKGKGNRKLSASQRGAARAAGECVPHAAALARLPVKTQEAARREPEQSGASAESAVTTHRGFQRAQPLARLW